MAITIRPLTLADEPFLWEMLYQALYVPAGQPPFPRSILDEPDISRYVQSWGRAGDAGYAAQDGEQPIGAAWLRLLIGDNRGYGYIDDTTPELSIAVLPAYRDQGVGSTLLAHLLEYAGSLYRAVCLSVMAESRAVRLYRSFGFEVVSEGSTGLTMVKRWRR